LQGIITYNEKELVELLKRRDVSSFSYLYDTYSAALYGAILQIIDDREMANSALQEAFLYFWNQINIYESSTGRLFTWMMHTARDTASRMRSANEIPSFK
jgi:DNA-directed RNA polymerase specialized sigma24 family protein